MSYTILYNPNAGSGTGTAGAREVERFLSGEKATFYDMTQIQDYARFFQSLDPDSQLVLCGGDGTLNRYVNEAMPYSGGRSVSYFATGTGNDFLCDIGHKKEEGPVCIDAYLRSLPQVTVGDRTYSFLNGVGYGIDGYCCQEGDRLREKSQAAVNYTAIAVKGLLFHYHPTHADITVDGRTYHYDRVWLAPTMNGRFYGGGMMPTPEQDRQNPEHTVSTMVYYGSGKLKSLAVFPSIFKGEHLRHTEMTQVLTGHDITVTFDRPTAIQIDGETILNVSSYTVHSQAQANGTSAE